MDRWKNYEAACLMAGCCPKKIKTGKDFYGRITVNNFPKGYEKAKEAYDIITTWDKKNRDCLIFGTWHPLKYINKWLLVGKKIPKKLLNLAEKNFLRSYNACELNDVEKFAKPFQNLIQHNTIVTKNNLTIENYIPLDIFLQNHRFTKIQLINLAIKENVELFLYLEKLEGYTDDNKGSTKHIEVTGLCKLTPLACKKLLLRNELDYVSLENSILLCDGQYKVGNNSGWEFITVAPETKGLIFQPFLYEEKNKNKAINPRYSLTPCAKHGTSNELTTIYCYAISTNKILVKKTATFIDCNVIAQNNSRASIGNFNNLPNCEFISLQNEGLKQLLHCSNEKEIIQHAIKGDFKVYINIHLRENQCIRERSLIIHEDNEEISYPFSFPSKENNFPIPEKMHEYSKDIEGKMHHFSCVIAQSNGYEILTNETLQYLLLKDKVEVSFFEVHDRDKKERRYVERYLGYIDEMFRQKQVTQIIKLNDLYVHKNDILQHKNIRVVFNANTNKANSQDSNVYILRKVKRKNKKQSWNCVVSNEELKSSDACNPALPYIQYIIKNAGKPQKAIDIYLGCGNTLHKEENNNYEKIYGEGDCSEEINLERKPQYKQPPNMKSLNHKEEISKTRLNEMKKYLESIDDNSYSIEDLASDYKKYIAEQLEQEHKFVTEKGKKSDFNIDLNFDYETITKTEFKKILHNHVTVVQNILNKIRETKETWKEHLKPYKNAKNNVRQSITRFLRKIENCYPIIHKHFTDNLHYNGTDTTYIYKSNAAWKLN